MVIFYFAVLLAVGFILYTCMFGASSTGFIGTLHHNCFYLRPLLKLCFGPRCGRFASKIEYVCCWRPNPALQLFYVALMARAGALKAPHSQLPPPSTS